MRFEIILAPEANEDLRKLRANLRTALRTALERHLRHGPTKTSRSRIKRLRGRSRPQYRLRVEEVRAFYDVSGSTLEILAIVAKSEAETWLSERGADVQYTCFYESLALPNPRAVDLVIAMGGPMSGNDERDYPWLKPEQGFVHEAIRRGLPVVGVCLGAQRIAPTKRGRESLQETGVFAGERYC